MERRRLSIIIPVYNEAITVERVIQRVLNAPINVSKEIIIVDDASTDTSRQVLETLMQPEMTLLDHDTNRGKGAADRSRSSAREDVLIQDANLEYDPRDYPLLLEPIMEDQADVVYGTVSMADLIGSCTSGTTSAIEC